MTGVDNRNVRQAKIYGWLCDAFGYEESSSIPHRGIRLLEESAEAAHAAGVDLAMAHKMLDYVWSRPKGELEQELGGVGVTVLGLAHAAGLLADACEKKEVDRVLSKPIEHFRQRNALKNEAGFRAVTVSQSITEDHIGKVVQVNNPRYHGAGILQRIDKPTPRVAWVKLEHGEDRWYEADTVTPL